MWFLLGLAVGGGVFWFFYFSSRREILRLDEEKQMLAQEKQVVLEFMHEMVESIGEGISRQQLFQRVVHAAIVTTGGLSACLFEQTADGRLQGAAVEGLFPPFRPLREPIDGTGKTRTRMLEQAMQEEVFSVGEGLVGSVAHSGRGVLIADATADLRVVQHTDPSLRVKTLLLAPIRFRETGLGVLAVANSADGVAFTEADFSLAQSLAEQAAMAIHNLDLMAVRLEKKQLDVDIALASSIQGMLLPRSLPVLPGFGCAAHYQAAQKVGGDLYDVIELGPQRVGVAVADVSGKGIPASLLMAICQSNLRHLARQFESPAQVLAELNMVMSEEMRQDMFVTIIYAIIDMGAQTLTLARAGHELPLLVVSEPSGEARVEFPGSDGMALGMVPTEFFESALADLRLPFRPGDVLVLFTDGMTETLSTDGSEFGKNRLAEVVLALRQESPEVINGGILNALLGHTGGQVPADDITILTVKREAWAPLGR